jgi:hypothetical protein
LLLSPDARLARTRERGRRHHRQPLRPPGDAATPQSHSQLDGGIRPLAIVTRSRHPMPGARQSVGPACWCNCSHGVCDAPATRDPPGCLSRPYDAPSSVETCQLITMVRWTPASSSA